MLISLVGRAPVFCFRGCECETRHGEFLHHPIIYRKPRWLLGHLQQGIIPVDVISGESELVPFLSFIAIANALIFFLIIATVNVVGVYDLFAHASQLSFLVQSLLPSMITKTMIGNRNEPMLLLQLVLSML